MGLDIRLPIGGLFVTMGILLVVYGAFSDSGLYRQSLGVNVNFDWGVVLLVFGLVMGVLGRRGMKMPRATDVANAKGPGAPSGGH